MNDVIDSTCCICDLDENLIKTTCNHIVHDDCLKQWFKYSKSGPICPMCRTLQPHDSSNEINIDVDYNQYNDLPIFWPPLLDWPAYRSRFMNQDFDGDVMVADFPDDYHYNNHDNNHGNNQTSYYKIKSMYQSIDIKPLLLDHIMYEQEQPIDNIVIKSNINKYKNQNKQKIFISKHQQPITTNSFKKSYR